MHLERDLKTYKYLDGNTLQLTIWSQQLSPISITQHDEPWYMLDQELLGQPTAQLPAFAEDSYNIMAGVTNLINTIELRHQEGNPIHTLIFLDRSGRLASHVLRTTYRCLEESSTYEHAYTFHKPDFRFLNVGTERGAKLSDPVAHQLLAHLYRKKDILEGHTIIVDEFISSGLSVKAAHKTLAEAGYMSTAPAMAMFSGCPRWHGIPEVKGSIDLLILPSVRTKLNEIQKRNPERLTKAAETVRQFGWQTLQHLIANPKRKHNVPKDELKNLTKLGKEVGNSTQVLLYLTTVGGFLGLPSSAEWRILGYDYRTQLETLVERAVTRNLITYEQL